MPLTDWTSRDQLLSDALHMRDVAMGFADPSPYAVVTLPNGLRDITLKAWAFDSGEDDHDEERTPWALAGTHGELEDYDFLVRQSRKPALTSEDRPHAASSDAHARAALLQSRFVDGRAASVWIELADDADALIESVTEDPGLTPRRPGDHKRRKGSVRISREPEGGGNPPPTHGDPAGGRPWPPAGPVWPVSSQRSLPPARVSAPVRPVPGALARFVRDWRFERSRIECCMAAVWRLAPVVGFQEAIARVLGEEQLDLIYQSWEYSGLVKAFHTPAPRRREPSLRERAAAARRWEAQRARV